MKEITRIELEKVPTGKERIDFECQIKLSVNWNYDIVDNTMEPTNHKSEIFFSDSKKPETLFDALSKYLKICFEQMDGVVYVDCNIEEVNLPKECKDSYDKFLKAHAESEKLRVKKEIEELENKTKQLKERLKKL